MNPVSRLLDELVNAENFLQDQQPAMFAFTLGCASLGAAFGAAAATYAPALVAWELVGVYGIMGLVVFFASLWYGGADR